MNRSSDTSERQRLEDAQQLQRWVRRYAQNRSLPVAVALGAFTLVTLAIGMASHWGGMAYRQGNMALLAICIGVLGVAMVALVSLSVFRWGGQRLQQLAQELYSREGYVAISTCPVKRPWLAGLLAAGFALCVTGNVILGLLGYLPTDKYMQPISAIYVVPFLVGLNFLMRPATGYIPLLWPLLYALHAALIVVGAPIAFTGVWEPLNMLVPIVGYGLLASLVGHAYGRWAWHHVRVLAARQADDTHRPLEESLPDGT
jgi:hypothetical protein